MNALPFRRIFRLFFLSLGLLLALVVVLTAGALLFARSDPGERWIHGQVSAILDSALEGSGLKIRLGGLSLPLPQGVSLRDLRLADTDGLWLLVPEARVRLRLAPLFSGRIAIDEVLVRDPVVFRAPNLPPSEPDPEEKPFTLASLGEILRPVADLLPRVQLDGVAVGDVRLGPPLLALPPDFSSLPDAQAGDPASDPEKMDALLKDFGADLETLLAASAAFPAASLHGAGPLDRWEGRLAARLPGRLRAAGSLALGCGGEWLAPEDGKSEAVLTEALLGSRIRLNLETDGEKAERLLDLDLLAVVGNEGQIGVPRLDIRFPDQVAQANQSDQAGQANQADQAAIHADASLSDEDFAANFQAALSAAAVQDVLRRMKPLLPADLEVSLPLSAADLRVQAQGVSPLAQKDFQTNVELESRVDGLPGLNQALRLQLGADLALPPDSLRLDRLDVRLNDQAARQLARIRAQGRLAPDDVGLRLRTEIPSLAALPLTDLPKDLAGAVALTLDVDRDKSKPAGGALPPMAGKLSLKADDMQLLPDLTEFLGRQLGLDLDFRAALPSAAQPSLDVQLDKLALASAHLKADGSGALSLPAETPADQGETPADQKEKPAQSPTFRADLRLAADSLERLRALSLAGSVEAKLKAAGALDAPDAEIVLNSPLLAYGATQVRQLRARVDAKPQKAPSRKASDQTTPDLSALKGALRVEGTIVQPGLTRPQGEALRLGADWAFRAPGPNQAGEASLTALKGEAPGLRLSGDLQARRPGTAGALPRAKGKLDLAVSDWGLVNSLAGLEGDQALRSRTATLALALNPDPAQDAQADLAIDHFSGAGVNLRDLRLRLKAADLFNRQNIDMNLQAGPGQAAGRRWNRVRADARGSLTDTPLAVRLDAQGEVSADLALNLNLPRQEVHIERLRAGDKATGLGAQLNKPFDLAFGRHVQARGLDLSLLPSGRLLADADLSPTLLKVEASLEKLALGKFRKLVSSLPDGTVNANVRLEHAKAFPSGDLTLNVAGIRYPDSEVPPLDLNVTGQLAAGARPALDLAARLGGGHLSDLQAQARVPLKAVTDDQGLPQPDMEAPLSGSASWEGDLASLWNFVPLANRRLTGQGKLDAAISGTLAQPDVQAKVAVAKAEYADILLGLLLSDINVDADLLSAGLSKLKVSLGDGKGGSAQLEAQAGPLGEGMPLDVRLALKELSPLDRNDLSINLSGNASVAGPAMNPDDLSVKADITVDRGEFKLVGSFGSSIPTLEKVRMLDTPDALAQEEEEPEEQKKASGPRLDVGVNLPGHFFVRGQGLESEWRGRLKVSGPASNPAIHGAITSVRGVLGLLSREFTLSEGIIHFTGPVIPSLNISLTYEGPEITAITSVTGVATKPKLQLSSQPPLPQDEIVSQVLFGQNAGTLSHVQSIQLANEVAKLAGLNAGNNILDSTRDLVGVDVLRLGSMNSGGSQNQTPASHSMLAPGQSGNGGESVPSLEMGKYVMDNVYVGFEQGMNGDSGVVVNIELMPNLSLDGRTGTQNSEVGLSWKKNY